MRLSITGLDVHFPAFFGLFFSRSFSPRHSPPEDQEALFQEIVTQVWHSVPSCCGEFAVMTWPHGVAAWCGCTVWLHGVALYSSMDSSDGERRHFEQTSGFEVNRDLISQRSECYSPNLHRLKLRSSIHVVQVLSRLFNTTIRKATSHESIFQDSVPDCLPDLDGCHDDLSIGNRMHPGRHQWSRHPGSSPDPLEKSRFLLGTPK